MYLITALEYMKEKWKNFKEKDKSPVLEISNSLLLLIDKNHTVMHPSGGGVVKTNNEQIKKEVWDINNNVLRMSYGKKVYIYNVRQY